jgi:dienelactone hydrolase
MPGKNAKETSCRLSARQGRRPLASTLFAAFLGIAACAPPAAEDTDAGGPESLRDAGTPPPSRDAGPTSVDAGAPPSANDAGAPSPSRDSGAPSSSQDSGAPDPSRDAGAPSPSRDAGVVHPDGGSGTGSDPTIPAINGECPVFQTGTVTVGGLGGISLAVGPKASGPTAPLVFYWHGTGGVSSEYTLRARSLASQVTSEGGILASFQGSTGTGGDCSGTAAFSQDDFKIADQIVACAVRDHNIDPHRIYATGCSAGGLQSGCMATLRSSYLAAAAPNSGGIVFPLSLQNPSHVPALMTMHGGSQDWVIVSFSDTSETLDSQFKKAGGFVINCNHGGGHCGAPADLYNSVWDFFKAHPFGVKPEPYQSGIPSSFPSYCKTY